MTWKTFGWLLGAGVLTVAACSRTPPASTVSASPLPTGPAFTSPSLATLASDCADGGPRFPISQLCQGPAIKDLGRTLESLPEPPADCSWTVNESTFPLPPGDGVLLYRALSCKGVTTKLEVSPGAPSTLSYAASALYPDVVKDKVKVVKIFDGGGQDPRKQIEALQVGIPNKAERASCVLQPAGIDGWPADALVIQPSAEARANAPKDKFPASCGEYGVDIDSKTFWRVTQGYAWYFQMGPDSMDFDPGSLLLMKKTAGGEWEAVK